MREKFQELLQEIYPNEKIDLIKCNRPSRTSYEVYFVNFKRGGVERIQTLVFKLFPLNIPGYKNPNLRKEVEVIKGFRKSGTVEVPEVVYYDPSNNIFGREFFALEGLEGISMSKLISNASTLNERKSYVKQCAELVTQIHSVDLSYFSSLDKSDYSKKTIKNFMKLYEELKKSATILENKDLDLMERTIRFLDKRRPQETDFALINGDLSTSHFLLSRNKYYIIDWDPAEIGDRSWDLYWMIKEIPTIIFGYEEALDDLIAYYEDISHKKLKNKNFYSQAALGWAHILGWYIEEKIPDHEMVPLIRQCRPGFETKLDRLLSK